MLFPNEIPKTNHQAPFLDIQSPLIPSYYVISAVNLLFLGYAPS